MRLAEKSPFSIKPILILDTSWFDTQSMRSYGLSIYSGDLVIATPSDLEPFQSRSILWRIKRKIYRVLELFSPQFRYRRVNELSQKYDKRQLEQSGHLYLNGYWQNEDYFNTIRNVLVRELSPRNPLTGKALEMMKTIQSCNSVSIHIRRGDYASDEKTNRIYGLLDMEYYTRATQWICSRIESPTYFIFTDEMKWVKENFHTPEPSVYVDVNGPGQEHQDIRLMSACNHHIIANSTFSWWGAWLSTHPQKIVIAPEKWFNQSVREAKDIIPETWIRM